MTIPTDLAPDDLHRLDRDHCWHPLYQHQQLQDGASQLTIFERGDGSTLYDAEGRAYLDGYGGLWNVNVGYGRQEIAEAVFKQLQRLPYYPHSQINEPATLLATRLAELTPGGLRHTFFSNSGSEANETAFKIARQYCQQRFPSQRRYKILSRYRGYHGFTFGAMSATGQMARRTKFEPLVPGFLHVDPPYCYRCPLHLSYPSCGTACVEEFDEVIRREGPETVAAIVVEPVIGGGGVIPSPDGYLQRLREICDEHQVLLIFDEVITGWGRTGKLFGCEHEGVTPDIMVMAKGITSGYQPLGATIVTDEVFEAFAGETADRREFAQVCTYGGHPAACAAALANIEILTSEKLWENAAKVGAKLLAGLRGLSSPRIGQVRGRGLMIGLELIDDEGELLG
ncbi:MAG: aminotransferase class III-fold pyridoxal phosphate-dependent enzyme, partial [Gemmatimonadetes bacterium]|nr:aminotransferase class III-fold pyridoxal phosphate-dependent enzyme [Gemmatimonadota bacterium]